jgi:very-short-patch-repair endonuclease
LPRLSIDWLYRRRLESLIAFSNHHYYHTRLLTFPAPHPAPACSGVRCVRVAGVYDRAGSQQNRIEAEALVAEVTARLRDPALARRSIGIVTFSRAQQTLIEDLLDAARRADPSLEAALAVADEELFVKNLENVQGDERDVILFSICYGPDAAGKIYENYGPLNLHGGERRLNVAVTRARRELIVFSSVGPEQVATRTESIGARHLRNFLDYALRGEKALVAAVERDPSRGVESPFEAAVRDALTRHGHEVHTQVGCSGYRIDLAVVDPSAPGRYLLGIECDGATYHRAATARDRDRLRAAVLEGLGWRLVRVWSTDFWQDPKGEIERLEAAIAAAKQVSAPVVPEPQPESQPESLPVAEPAPTVEVPDSDGERDPLPPVADPDGPRPYVAAELPVPPSATDSAAAAAAGTLRQQALVLLDVEAPIVFDRFARSLAAAWNVGRVTERIREWVREALPPGAVEHGSVLWRNAAQRDAFRGFRVPADGDGGGGDRSAEELPPPEIEHAMLWLLRQHHALAADDLLRETARTFGIQRLGSVVRDVMERALERLVAADGCGRDGDVVRPRDPAG